MSKLRLLVQAHSRRVISKLEHGYVTGPNCAPVSLLCRANGGDPWVKGTASVLELPDLSEQLSDKWSREAAEMAVVYAVTAWAFCQRSRHASVQGKLGDSGVLSFGQAARKLDDNKVPRGFESALRSRGVDAAGKATLSLAHRFRSSGLVVDYARLAGQLSDLGTSWTANDTRRDWNHEYYDPNYGIPKKQAVKAS